MKFNKSWQIIIPGTSIKINHIPDKQEVLEARLLVDEKRFGGNTLSIRGEKL